MLDRRSDQEWTIQINWQHWVHKTQDEDNENKNTTQKTKKMKTIKHEPSYKVETNRTSFLYGNRNGQHNTELKT